MYRARVTDHAKICLGGSGVGFLVFPFVYVCFAPVGQPDPNAISLTLTQTPLSQLTAWSQFMAGVWV